MRFDQCRCPFRTPSQFEAFIPFDDHPETVMEIERCTKCNKIKKITQKKGE